MILNFATLFSWSRPKLCRARPATSPAFLRVKAGTHYADAARRGKPARLSWRSCPVPSPRRTRAVEDVLILGDSVVEEGLDKVRIARPTASRPTARSWMSRFG